jgi:hypothetical protein
VNSNAVALGVHNYSATRNVFAAIALSMSEEGSAMASNSFALVLQTVTLRP